MSSEQLKDFLVGTIAIGAGIGLSFIPGGAFLSKPLYAYGVYRILESMEGVPDITGIQINVLSTQAPVPVVYGRALVGLKFMDIRNVDSTDSDTPSANPGNIISGALDNHILGEVGVFAIGSEDGSGVESVEEVRFYGDWVVAAINPVTADAALGNAGVLSKYSDNLRYHLRLGTDAQTVHTDLQDQLGWGTDMKGRGLAYLALFLLFDREVWKGRPSVTLLVRGNKMYDPRTSTWLYPNYGTRNGANPALVILDYLTSKRYGAGIPYSARDGGPLDFIDEQSFIDAANYCEASVTIPGGTQDRFSFNGAVDTARLIAINLVDMLATCRGELVWQQGKYRLIIRQVTTAESYEITEDNILSIEVAKKGVDVPNSISASYVDSLAGNYQDDSVIWPLVGDTTYFDEDNGIENRIEVTLPYTGNQYQVIQTIMVLLREARQDVFADIVLNQGGLQLEVGNVVNVTHEGPGWVQQPMMVRQIALAPDGKVNVGLQKYDANVYNLDSLSTQPSTPTTNLPDPTIVLPPTTLTWTADSTTAQTTQQDSVVPRALLTWATSPDPFLRKYEVQIQTAVGGIWRQAAPDPLKDDTSVYIQGITDGVAYDVRIRAVNTIGNASVWVTLTNQGTGTLDENRLLNAFLRSIPFVDVTGVGSGIDEDIIPDADTSDTGDWVTSPHWNDVGANGGGVAESIVSDLSCPSKSAYTFSVRLANPGGTPAADSDQQSLILHLRIRMQQTSGTNCYHGVLELYQGDPTGSGVLKATLTQPDETDLIYHDLTYTISNAEYDSITDHDDLYLKVIGNVGHEDEASRDPFLQVDKIKVQYLAKAPTARGVKIDLIYDVTAPVDELDILVRWNEGAGELTFAYTQAGIAGVAGVERIEKSGGGDFFMREGWTGFSIDVTPVAQPGDLNGPLVKIALEDTDESGIGIRAALSAGGTARSDYFKPGTGVTIALAADGRVEISAPTAGGSLGGLSDVTLASVATNEILQKSAGDWINRTLSEAGIAAASHDHVQADITDWPLTVARGGTQVVSPISGNLLVGAGASAMTLLAHGASGGFVRSSGSAWVRNTIQVSDLPSHTHNASEIDAGILVVARGGIGVASPTTGNILIGAGASAMTLLAGGATGHFVRWSGSAWVSSLILTGDVPTHTHAFSDISGIVPVIQGGTGLATVATGGVLIGESTSNFSVALAGAAGGVLRSDGTRYVRLSGYDTAIITSGTFTTGQIPSLDVSKITSGTFAVSFIPDLSASKITSGILAVAQGGTGVANPTLGRLVVGAGTSAMTLLAGVATGHFVRWSAGGAWVSSLIQTNDVPTHGHAFSDISGIVPVTQGGTGLATVATGGVLIGESASTFSVALPGAVGGLLRSDGTRYVRVSGLATSDITSGVFTTAFTAAKIASISVGTALDITAGDNPNITLDFDEYTNSATLVGGDHLVSIDGTVSGKTQISEIPLSIFLNDAGYSSGDIDRVDISAGNGLTGSQNTLSGDHIQTLSLDFANMSVITSGTLIGADHLGVDDGGITKRARIDEIDVGIFNDDGTYSLVGHSHIVSDIISGTFAVSFIPDLNASKIDAGTFGAGNYTFPGMLGVAGNVDITKAQPIFHLVGTGAGPTDTFFKGTAVGTGGIFVIDSINAAGGTKLDLRIENSVILRLASTGLSITGTLDVTGNVTLGTITSGTWEGTAVANAFVADLPTSKITSGVFTVPFGGTGRSALTTGNLIIGAGTAAVTLLAGTTPLPLLRWNGSAWVAAVLETGDIASHEHNFSDITSGSVSVAQGGTGLATVATGGVLIGESTSPFSVALAGAAGGVLRSDGTRYVRISGYDAAIITGGILTTNRIPNLDASKITTGDFNASRIDSGTFGTGNYTFPANLIVNAIFNVKGASTFEGNVFISNGDGLVIGHTSQITVGGHAVEMQVLGTGQADTRIAIGRFSNNLNSARLVFLKSRSTIGSFAIVQVGDGLGAIDFDADDGGDYGHIGAQILVSTEGTIAANRIPTKMTFATGTNAAPSVVTVALTLDSAQKGTFSAAVEIAGQLTLTGGLNTPLVVAQGGTGRSALTSGTVMIGAGTSAVTMLAGTTGDPFLRWSGSAWIINKIQTADVPSHNHAFSDISGTVPVGQGGTGITTAAAGAVLIGESTSPMSVVVPGLDGGVLRSNGSRYVRISGYDAAIITGGTLATTRTAAKVVAVTGSAGITSSGGGSPNITLNLDGLGTSTAVGGDSLPFIDGTLSRKQQISTIGLSLFLNDLSANGTITRVDITPGVGLSSDNVNTTSGDYVSTIDLDLSTLDVGGTPIGGDKFVYVDGSASRRIDIQNVPLGVFSNNLGWTANAGTVTSVIAGTGMTQSGSSTVNPTLNVIGASNRIIVNANNIDIHANYVGQTSITTLGTITSGAISAARITNGTFGSGNYVFPANVQVNGQSNWPVHDNGTKTATWTLNANNGNVQEVLINGNTADLTSITNWSEGAPLHVFVKWNGGFGAAFDMTMVDWGDAGEPNWSSQAAKTDWVVLVKNGTKIFGSAAVGFAS